MIELSGSLASIGLPAVVRLLAGLGASGRLRISQHRHSGDLLFHHGQVVGASFGVERGRAALAALAIALPHGTFAFAQSTGESAALDAPPEGERSLDLSADELVAYLESLAAQRATAEAPVPSLDAVPRLVEPVPHESRAARLALTRRSLATLLLVDGERTVADIAASQGVANAFETLAALVELRLITFGPSGAAPATATGPPVEAGLPIERSHPGRTPRASVAAEEWPDAPGGASERPPARAVRGGITHNGRRKGRGGFRPNRLAEAQRPAAVIPAIVGS